MAATPLAVTSRYIPVGTRQYYWVETIANKAAPTRIELDAGTDLTAEIPQDGVTGFTKASTPVDAPDMKTRFTSQVSGLITADTSSLNIYLSKTADNEDARSIFLVDTTGFIVIFPEGDSATATPATTMDVWPVSVQSASKSQGGADVAILTVTFSITSEPVENVPVPAV